MYPPDPHSSNRYRPVAMASPPQVYLLPLKDDGSPDVPGVKGLSLLGNINPETALSANGTRSLDDESKHVSRYIYLAPPPKSGYVLRFIIEGTSSICRQGSLWVNMVASRPEVGRPLRRVDNDWMNADLN
jgi:glycogen debranching enzyme